LNKFEILIKGFKNDVISLFSGVESLNPAECLNFAVPQVTMTGPSILPGFSRLAKSQALMIKSKKSLNILSDLS